MRPGYLWICHYWQSQMAGSIKTRFIMKMSNTKQILLTILMLFTASRVTLAQVYISEIGLEGTDYQGATQWVELYNSGESEIDVSSYFLCNFPQYPRISELTVLSGNTTMPAGGFLVVAWPGLGDADGEVGLYLGSTTDFGDAGSIVDYMQYGIAGHFREGAAVTAGVWETGGFTSLPLSGKTISRISGVEGLVNAWRVTDPSPGANNPTLYRAVLSGGNQTPAVISRAQGALEGLLDGSTLTITGRLENLESDYAVEIAGGTHLHKGIAGNNGGIAVFLNAIVDADERGATFEAENNTFEVSEGLADSLAARYLYVNVHTDDYPGGELRGQMLPAVSEGYKMVISGAAQVPVNTSSGQGSLIAEIQDSLLIVSGSFNNLSSAFNPNIAGGAHIHVGMAGQNGGIEFFLNATTADDNLSGVFEPSNNTFPISEEQKELFRQRSMYINIHTQQYPGGEVRGQAVALSSTPFIADLSGANQTPANASLGTGSVLAELSGSQVWVSGSFMGLSDAFNPNIAGGAHVHDGLAGQNGGIAFGLTATLSSDNLGGTFEVSDNTFEFDETAIGNLQARRYYINLHTDFNLPGELRGQLLPAASIPLRSVFSGRAQLTPNMSNGIGGAMVEMQGNSLVVSGSFTVDSPFADAIGAHIHSGFIDEEGSVDFALVPSVASDGLSGSFEASENTFELSDEIKDGLLTAQHYINIHTDAYNGGEIRGQITPYAYRLVETYLSFNNQVVGDTTSGTMFGFQADSDSDAFGAMLGLVSDTTLIVSGSFSGLASDFNSDIAGGAHIHQASIAGNGGIELLLTTTLNADNRGGQFEADANTFALTQDQVSLLFGEELYINIHSVDIPSGELRGQIVASGNVAPSAPIITSPEDGQMIVITGDPETPFVATWNGGDTNANATYYVWELGLDAEFESVVLVSLSAEPTFESNFGDVATLLTSAGVNLGETTTFYHRAIATDGNYVSVGEPVSVVLTRSSITSNEGSGRLPERFALKGNYPNPFNPTTTVQFDLPDAAEVSIEIFDILGRRVLSIPQISFAAGTARSVEIDASLLSSGLYLYQVTARMTQQTRVETGRMTLLK